MKLFDCLLSVRRLRTGKVTRKSDFFQKKLKSPLAVWAIPSSTASATGMSVVLLQGAKGEPCGTEDEKKDDEGWDIHNV